MIAKETVSLHKHWCVICTDPSLLNLIWLSDAKWCRRSWSTFAEILDCCLTAPSHYINQCWQLINELLWHSSLELFCREWSRCQSPKCIQKWQSHICHWWTHWPLGNLDKILAIFKLTLVNDGCSISCEIDLKMNVTEPYWKVNLGSGNGLVPSDNKPLPKQMLTQICVAIWSLGHNELINEW